MPWQKPKPEDGFNLDAAIMQVRAVWPGEFQGIDWLDFWFLYRGIPRTLALHRVNLTRAVAIGFSGGKEAESEHAKDRKEAFPE